jgi:methylglutaconyl-CoA hydratase
MSELRHIRCTTAPTGVATLTLDRPEVHNAFDDALIAELTGALHRLDADHAVRVVVLASNGRSFSAGADLGWMKRMANYTESENLSDALRLADLLHTLDRMHKPTIARVQGSAFGGGVGLVACCDIVVAAREAQFCLSEVRLGLIPATISPYVVQAIGARASRRYFMTAERFGADEARRLGLVSEVVDADALDATVAKFAEQLLMGGPHALAASKDLISTVADKPIDASLMEITAHRIAHTRASTEGREGVMAFLEKRRAAWLP